MWDIRHKNNRMVITKPRTYVQSQIYGFTVVLEESHAHLLHCFFRFLKRIKVLVWIFPTMEAHGCCWILCKIKKLWIPGIYMRRNLVPLWWEFDSLLVISHLRWVLLTQWTWDINENRQRRWFVIKNVCERTTNAGWPEVRPVKINTLMFQILKSHDAVMTLP